MLDQFFGVTSRLTISLWITGPFAYKQALKEQLKFLRNKINNENRYEKDYLPSPLLKVSSLKEKEYVAI